MLYFRALSSRHVGVLDFSRVGGAGGGPLTTDECLVVLSKGRRGGSASIGWTSGMNKGKLKQKMLGESAACNIFGISSCISSNKNNIDKVEVVRTFRAGSKRPGQLQLQSYLWRSGGPCALWVPNLYLWFLSFFFVQFLWHILAEAFWVNRGRLHMAHGAVWFDFLRWVLKRRFKAYDRRGMKKTSILKIFLDDLQIPWAIIVPECWTCCLMPYAQFKDCCWCSWIAAPTIRNVPKVQTARPWSGNVWIWNSLERGWVACFDWWGSQVRACKMMMLCWVSYSYRLVYGIRWIGGDGWSHESTWKRADFCESVHDCAIDVGGFKKTRKVRAVLVPKCWQLSIWKLSWPQFRPKLVAVLLSKRMVITMMMMMMMMMMIGTQNKLHPLFRLALKWHRSWAKATLSVRNAARWFYRKTSI